MFKDIDYLLNYPPLEKAVHNLRFAQRAVDVGQWQVIRVFVSDIWPCVVLTRLDVAKVKDPHVDEWRDTMYEISIGELLSRAAQRREGVTK